MINLPVHRAGANLAILPGTEITGSHRMEFGDNVTIGRDCQLMIATERTQPGPMIVFGNGTSINRRALIAAVNEIVFGQYVLTAPGIYCADSSHEFRNVGIPITMQGLKESKGKLEICSHSWIGMNAALIGNIRIGRGSVVGSNAVVNQSIPDYCVAAGQPAQVIRAYDTRSKQWERISGPDHLLDILKNRLPIPDVADIPPAQIQIYAGEMLRVI